MRNSQLDVLEQNAGIVFHGAMDFLPRHPSMDGNGRVVRGEYGGIDEAKALAMDAAYSQPGMISAPNAGVLSAITMMIDPKVIDVLLAPMNSEKVYGVAKKGDWLMQTFAFPMVEMTGYVASYGDFNETGRSDANVQWPMRQNYLFQTFIEYGDREVEMMGLARLDWINRKKLAAANSLNRFANNMNFFGISGLINYGGLNDPSLSAALTPAIKAAGGTSWQSALPTEILADVQALFAKAQGQMGGNLTLEMPMTLAIHPTTDVYLANANSFGLSAAEMVKKAFPNLKVETAIQYLAGTTYSAQLIVDEVEGQRTVECAFSEKMRGHRVIAATSSYKQKSSAGGWGTIIYRPAGISAMAGI